MEAVVTRPVFSTDNGLLIPEGTRLLGDVVEAHRARLLHRNGKVLFVFPSPPARTLSPRLASMILSGQPGFIILRGCGWPGVRRGGGHAGAGCVSRAAYRSESTA